MNIEETRKLAEKLFKEFGLEDYKFKISSRTGVKYLGRCWPRQKYIEISLWHIVKHPEHVEETVRHEIAHALDYIRFKKIGHGLSWKAMCLVTGANPSKVICYDTTPLWRAKGTCPKCGKTFFRLRMPRRKMQCIACCRKFMAVPPVIWTPLQKEVIHLDESDF
jgi:predicted SprT family Zn-dependent metalloprotease